MIRRSTTYGTAVIDYTLRRSARRTLSISVDAEGILVVAPEPQLIIRSMQKRWGSHTPSGRIILNDRLITARRECIDYVIVHEICHVVEPNHSPRFFRLLRRFMPDWEQRKEMLERSAV